jgi:hypothetical protein
MAEKAFVARQDSVGKGLINRNQMCEERGRKKLLSLTAPTVTSRTPLIDLSLCQYYCVVWQQLLAARVSWVSKIQRTINCWSLNTGHQDFIHCFLLMTLREEIKERIIVKGFIDYMMSYSGFVAKQMIRSKDIYLIRNYICTSWQNILLYVLWLDYLPWCYFLPLYLRRLHFVKIT